MAGRWSLSVALIIAASGDIEAASARVGHANVATTQLNCIDVLDASPPQCGTRARPASRPYTVAR